MEIHIRQHKRRVLSVDVDWEGLAAPADENGEEARFVVVPLNTNGVDDIRRILLWDPYDDDERNKRPNFPHPAPVHPDITLDWDARDAFLLVEWADRAGGRLDLNSGVASAVPTNGEGDKGAIDGKVNALFPPPPKS